MKNKIGLLIGLPAAAVAAWFMVMDISNTKEAVNTDLSVRVCTNMSINNANEVASNNEYYISVEALKMMRNVAKEQCEITVAEVGGGFSKPESMNLIKAKKMFADGFDYEEQYTIRHTARIAKEYGKEFGLMSEREIKAWTIKYQQQNNH